MGQESHPYPSLNSPTHIVHFNHMTMPSKPNPSPNKRKQTPTGETPHSNRTTRPPTPPVQVGPPPKANQDKEEVAQNTPNGKKNNQQGGGKNQAQHPNKQHTANSPTTPKEGGEDQKIGLTNSGTSGRENCSDIEDHLIIKQQTLKHGSGKQHKSKSKIQSRT
jgi:hypothetical protein